MENKMETINTTNDWTCRRQQSDRRRCSAKTAFHSLYRNRRHSHRREIDADRGSYVDTHEPRLFVISLAIMLLCIVDAVFTITLLNFGGRELNPIMAFFINEGIGSFFFVKYLLTALSLFLLLAHKRFRLTRRITGYHVLNGVLGLYVCLVVYEISLLAQLPIWRSTL
jgi:hypothetical protein